MPTKTSRSKLNLNEPQQRKLKAVAQSLRLPHRQVQRAKILMRYDAGEEITSISKALKISRVSIYKWIDRALAMGPEAALADKYHRPREAVITEQAKAWVVHLACTKPKEHGYAAELWSHRTLAEHVRVHAIEAGHRSLQRAAKATVQRILKEMRLQPHKVKYYLERRDPQFEEKMRQVLIVYEEVNLQNQITNERAMVPSVMTVSVDEKPGLQAIENTVPDLPPQPGKHPQLRRDHEYKRHGTLSILAGLDLHDGHVFAQVHGRHRSREFISLLKELDEYYPPSCMIRLILDNHSAHISKETMRWLAHKPNRFIYVHTPKHGSWLNLVEALFGKMARTFLKQIRVKSKEELRARILLGVEEMNKAPTVFRWGKFEALYT